MSSFTKLILIFVTNFIIGYMTHSVVKEYFSYIIDSTIYQIAYVIFMLNFASIMGKAMGDYLNGRDDFYYRLKRYSENKEMGKRD